MSPSFSRGSNGRLYRYYVSASLQQGAGHSDDDIVRRLAAPAFEQAIAESIARWLPSLETPLELPLAIRLLEDGLNIDLPADHAADIASRLSDDERIVHTSKAFVRIEAPLALPMRGGKRLVIAGTTPTSRPDPILINALRKAHRMVRRDRSGLPVIDAAPVSPYRSKLLRLAFLSPDLQRDILAGHHPPMLNLEQLMKTQIPLDWKEQRAALGWPPATRSRVPCSI